MSSKDLSREDGLRDWYLLEPEDLSMVSNHGQTYVVPKAPMTPYKDDWSAYEVQDTAKGPKYLPPWWAANLDLRRSLDYVSHWQTGSRKLLGQHDTGVDPSLALHRSDAMGAMYISVPDQVAKGWPGDSSYDI